MLQNFHPAHFEGIDLETKQNITCVAETVEKIIIYNYNNTKTDEYSSLYHLAVRDVTWALRWGLIVEAIVRIAQHNDGTFVTKRIIIKKFIPASWEE